MKFRTLILWLCLAAIGNGEDAKVLEVENIVQTSRGPSGTWTPAQREQSLEIGDRIRTRQRSRATVRLSDLYTMRLEQFTTIEIAAALFDEERATLDLGGGVAFIFSREKSGEIDIKTPTANGAMRGTQIVVKVAPDGSSRFQVLEGALELSNPKGTLLLSAGEAGEANPGQAPRRTAVIETNNLLQWALYYPGVIDPDELGMTGAERRAVADSLAAYRAGDLLGALENYPDRNPAGRGGRLYRAAVHLSVGRLDEVTRDLQGVPPGDPARRAMERTVAAAKFQEGDVWNDEDLGTAGEALAESYYRQSRWDLAGARRAARIATERSPDNGFAWTRLAELEFSFARTREARAALAKGLEGTPRNARAHALQGFLLSAENEIDAARRSFEEATRLDGALGMGWLGRGLTRTKSGDLEGGRSDLQTAATVEPTMSIYQSYLGKALGMEGNHEKAHQSLELARQLDPNDPTPWLYSAIELQRGNRINEAISDLERSIELNDNRRVYRSQFLLDQDRAVRSANLARIYQAAGMQDVAVREATRAVESDYTNPSAHLFLANSFDALRDPARIQLRYETPWFNELLLSNLLSPVGGGPLSQFVSQQEYSKMLESDGVGASFLSELRSDGESRSIASLFGTSGNVSWGIDAYYRDDNGDRFNSDANLAEIYAQFKWQATPDDILYFLGKWQDQESGDNFDTYDNSPLEPFLDFEEKQEPGLLLAGWNHRWKPGSNTLFLAGRLSAEQTLTNPRSNQLLVERDAEGLRPDFIMSNGFLDEFTDPALDGSVASGDFPGSLVYSGDLLRSIQPYLGRGDVLNVSGAPFAFETRREFEIYSAEAQHILQTERNLLIAGGRWQSGEFETDTLMFAADEAFFQGGFEVPAVKQRSKVDFDRLGLYVYDYWKVNPCLTLIGGLSYDHIEYPDNFRNPPVNDDQRDEEEVSGKLGFTYTPGRWLTLRGVYTEGLGGVTFDESVRLEPVQIAGFNQSYRTVISESVAGSVEAPHYKIWGLSAEGQLASRTWWGASFNVIDEEVDRTRGIFTGYSSSVFPSNPAYFPDGMSEELDYEERSLTLTLNQLIGDQFSVGAGLRITKSELDTTLPELVSDGRKFRLSDEATLTEIMLNANWNSPTGWFARVEANYYTQDIEDNENSLVSSGSGDSFWQFNALAGYRFWDNNCEIAAGVLNIGDTDYRLNPLNPRQEIVRDRTAVLRFRITF